MPAILFYFLLGLILTYTDSFFRPFWIWVLIGAFAAFAMSLMVKRPFSLARLPKWEPSHLISLSSAASSFLLWMRPNILYVQNKPVFALLQSGIRICLLLSLARLLAGLCRYKRTALALTLGFVVILLALRILVIYASPNPRIDVFVILSKACQALLSGRNPYTEFFPDIYGGKYGYRPQFSWWPMHFIYPLPFYLLGDVRFGSVVADAVTAFLLMKIARKVGLSRDLGLVLAGAWLCFPVSLHVIEQSWIEPALAMFTALLTLSLLNRKWYQAGLWIGIMGATKQFMPIVAILTFAFLFSAHRKQLPKVVAGSLFTFSALVIPFVAINPWAFIESTVISFITRPMRLDSLSIPSLVAHLTGVSLGEHFLAVIYAFALGVGAFFLSILPPDRVRLRHWTTTMVLVFGLVVILGKQAFCNYYALLSFFVLMTGLLSFSKSREQ